MSLWLTALCQFCSKSLRCGKITQEILHEVTLRHKEIFLSQHVFEGACIPVNLIIGYGFTVKEIEMYAMNYQD